MCHMPKYKLLVHTLLMIILRLDIFNYLSMTQREPQSISDPKKTPISIFTFLPEFELQPSYDTRDSFSIVFTFPFSSTWKVEKS